MGAICRLQAAEAAESAHSTVRAADKAADEAQAGRGSGAQIVGGDLHDVVSGRLDASPTADISLPSGPIGAVEVTFVLDDEAGFGPVEVHAGKPVVSAVENVSIQLRLR